MSQKPAPTSQINSLLTLLQDFRSNKHYNSSLASELNFSKSDRLSDAMYQTNPPRPPSETMPTMYDLPSELIGESGLPDEFHRIQADGLSATCQPQNLPPDEVFIAIPAGTNVLTGF
jgi:hypothetical protein